LSKFLTKSPNKQSAIVFKDCCQPEHHSFKPKVNSVSEKLVACKERVPLHVRSQLELEKWNQKIEMLRTQKEIERIERERLEDEEIAKN